MRPLLFSNQFWCATFTPNVKNITFGNNCEIDRTTPFTLSAWIYPLDVSNAQASWTIAAKFQDPTPLGYDWEIISGTMFWHQIQDYGFKELRVQSAASTVSANVWQHAAITGDGTGTYAGMKMYINGVSLALTNVEDTLDGSTATAQAFYLGYTQNETEGFSGTIANFGFYNRALALAEIQDIYHAGRQANLTYLSSAYSLIHYWLVGQGDTLAANGILDRVGAVPGTAQGMVAGDLGVCPY